MVIEPNNIITQGLTYHLFAWWSLDPDYRYSRFTSDSTGNYQSLLNGTTSAAGTTEVIWRDGLSDLDFSMDFTPIHTLLIRPGVQFLRSDVESLTNGVINAGRHAANNTVRPENQLRIRTHRSSSAFGATSTARTTARRTRRCRRTRSRRTHFVCAFIRSSSLTIEDEVNVSNNKLLTTNFQNNIRSNAITVSYSLGDRFSIFGGFSYDSYYAQGDIHYARGTAPLADFAAGPGSGPRLVGRDRSEADEAVRAAPVGEFRPIERSSGAIIRRSRPPMGPLAWPLITGTVYYNLPKAGRVAMDLQRTYYIEQIVTVNNFSANLLTIRWTKAF